MTRPLAVVKFGLAVVGLGEYIADAGGAIAGCVRKRTPLYPRALRDEVPYAPPVPRRRD